MGNFVKSEHFSKEKSVNVYSGIDKSELINKVNDVFLSSKYKLTEGEPGNATYTRGSKLKRILFGAASKHFVFDVVVSAENDGTLKVSFEKKTSGIAGGIIGMDQVNTELIRINSVLQSF